VITFITVRANLSYMVNKGITFRQEQQDAWFGGWNCHLFDLLTAARVLKQDMMRDYPKKLSVSMGPSGLHHWTKPRRRETQQHSFQLHQQQKEG